MQTSNNDGYIGQADGFICEDDAHIGREVDLMGREDGFICQNGVCICEVVGCIGQNGE